jgi:hypothetical protein
MSPFSSFPFSWMHISSHNKLQRRPWVVVSKTNKIRFLVGLLVIIQVLVVYKATMLHNDKEESLTMKNHLQGSKQTFSHSQLNLPVKVDGSPTTTTTLTTKRAAPPVITRVLVGIISSAYSHGGKRYRKRFRTLFSLWNDTRTCSLAEFTALSSPQSSPCQIIYTFVIGGNPNGTALLLNHNNSYPLVLTKSNQNYMQQFNDVNASDVTVLNIRENMNDGKTPTFFYFASQILQQYPMIQYVMKCDTDASFRLYAMLQFINTQLPKARYDVSSSTTTTTTSTRPPLFTAMGSLRRKAEWPVKPTPQLVQQYEGFWQEEYDGTHLYLAGQLYILSWDLLPLLIQEAQKPNNYNPNSTSNYLEGHEDHDATSLLVKALSTRSIRWIEMGRRTKFWEHPVKGDYWFNRIMKREHKRMENLPPHALAPPVELARRHGSFPRVLMVLLASDETSRKRHEQVLQADSRVCTLQDLPSSLQTSQDNGADPSLCPLVYTFAVGGNPDGPTERLADDPILSPLIDPNQNKSNILSLNIRENLQQGMVQTILYYVSNHTHAMNIDYIIISHANVHLNLEQLFSLVDSHLTLVPSHSHSRTTLPVFMGFVKDKAQEPRQFPKRNETYFYNNLDALHLYFDSECYLVSASLAGLIVQQAQQQDYKNESSVADSPRRYFEGDHGHDVSTMAFMVPKTNLQLIQLTRSERFWKKIPYMTRE